MDGEDRTPGPVDPSVLTLQGTHRSVAVWDQTVDPAKQLVCRHYTTRFMVGWGIDPRVLAYVEFVGLGGFHRMAYREIDRALVTALAERWRQETHSFHLPVGETTVTLRDVAILTRLPVHGSAVTGHALVDPVGLVGRVLGVQPGPADIRGSGLRTGWVRETFRELPPGADDAQVQRYARAYLFFLISGVLFGNKSGIHLQLIYVQLLDHDWDHIRGYSWGSACLATLYRQLCRASHVGANEIGGPLIVLQFWAWEHIHVGRPGRPAIHRRGEQDQDDQYQAYDAPPLPTPDEAYGCRWVVPRLTHAHAARGLPYYRDALDRLTEDQVTWDPYVPDLVDAMPPHLLDHQAEWRARVPLICFEVVESHLPDRVMRQFGLRQTIPQGCDTSVQLHGIDRRGKGETSWALEHWRFLQLWEQRLEFIVGGDLMQGAMDPDDPYMVWYRRITRRFINPSYAPPSTHYHPAYDIISGYAADMVAMVDALSVSLECGPTRAQVEQVRDMGVATLRRYGHAHLAHRRGGHDGNSQFDLGQSSGGCDPTSPRHAEDYNIHSTAPSGTQEDPSSSQLTPPPPRDPFTTVTHYRRRRVRRRADTQEAGPLPRINESG
ncbi:serine/threonine-protein phosphatase 7 long form homolog [Chenopodium quinoa]|uniref:serine/threonine-protein phosphatase 7 long form homolog n=1 Tax=Chenopodium quinoa TaxID=63459 RepID=UPI000B799972|nr:serine/threonine-protein phosphatase 7 long form homolog [Chenopodium quinoa]